MLCDSDKIGLPSSESMLHHFIEYYHGIDPLALWGYDAVSYVYLIVSGLHSDGFKS